MSVEDAETRATARIDAGLERLRTSTISGPAKAIIRQCLGRINGLMLEGTRALRLNAPPEELTAANLLLTELAIELVQAGHEVETAVLQAKTTS